MTTRMVFGSIALLCVLALPATAGGKDGLQGYFNTAATKVRATDNPSEKRQILNESFQTMEKALDVVQGSPSISTTDRAAIDRLKATIQDKQDELAGRNGYTRVPDEQLNAFSNYAVQDMEQADTIVTVSLVTLILLAILLVLLVR